MELAPGFSGKARHPAVYPLHHIGVVGTPLSAAGSAGIPLFVGCAASAASEHKLFSRTYTAGAFLKKRLRCQFAMS
jgi:hypothetical protein